MRGVLREGSRVASKYEFIDEMRLDTVEYAYSIEFMCDHLDVSKSGYYNWPLGRPKSATAQRREELKLLIHRHLRMPTARTATGASTPSCTAGATPRAWSWSAGSCASWALSPVSRGRNASASPSTHPGRYRISSAGTSRRRAGRLRDPGQVGVVGEVGGDLGTGVAAAHHYDALAGELLGAAVSRRVQLSAAEGVFASEPGSVHVRDKVILSGLSRGTVRP